MRPFLRRLARPAPPPDRVVLLDVEAAPAPDAGAVLRRAAAETLILQDAAETVLDDIRARQSLGYVAPRAGPLIRRFFALREQLPTEVAADDLRTLRTELAAILGHHAMAVSVAMDFLAAEWRSPTVAHQLDALDGLGAPARRLEEIYALLAVRPAVPA